MAGYIDTTKYGDDYIGVVPIYRPSVPLRGRIFALHGLGGNWSMTWTQPATGRGARDIFWPRDLLPKEFPDCEISCVAWPPDLSEDAVIKIAHNIQQFIVNAAPEKRAPIVFIVHSLGPFEMLFRFLWPIENSPVSTSDGSISLDTHINRLEPLIGIVFLGAPHLFQQSQAHYRRFFPASVHENLNECTKDTFGNERRQSLAGTIAQRPLKIISIFEQPGQARGHVPVFTREEVSLEALTEYEIVVGVAKTHSSLAKFISRTEDDSFVLLCSGLKNILDHQDDFDQASGTTQMNLLHIRSLDGAFYRNAEDLARLGRIDYKPMRGQIDITKLGSWIHFPANNTIGIDHAFYEVWKLHGVHTYLTEKSFPGTILKARSNFPTSRYILRSANYVSPNLEQGHVIHFNIFLPYLHWDTKAGAEVYTKWLKQRYLSGISDPFEHLSAPFRTYHPRRTLDQYYYSRLEDTTERDDDQIVSKQTWNAIGGPKMIMVDQLWLGIWLLSKPETMRRTSTIVTSFPDTSYARPGTVDNDQYFKLDMRNKVLAAFASRPMDEEEGAVSVAIEILTNVLTGMLSFRGEWSLEFLELFREAIGKVTETHSKFFRVFTASMSDGNSKRLKTAEFRLALQNEFRLSFEIADIIDELHMLKQLLQNQIDALREANEQLPSYGLFQLLRDKIRTLWTTLRNDYLAQVTLMIENAERAQKSILNLLDLQQKQDSIDEAHSSNQTALLTAKQTMSSQDQADATDAQSQILFIFTFVTIVFLPLSFFTSYYGMNVEDPQGNQILRKASYVWKVMGGSSFPIITSLLLGGVVWYVWSKNKAKKKRIEDLAELEKNGALPSGLFKEDDPVYEEIRQKADNIREAEAARKRGARATV